MAKFFTLCATFIAFLVATVAAVPQEHLAPDAHHHDASKSLSKRVADPNEYQLARSGNPTLLLEGRQVHNADYGSDNGPSGNPQTQQQSAEAASSSAGSGSDDGAHEYHSADEKKHRDLASQHSRDINYNQES